MAGLDYLKGFFFNLSDSMITHFGGYSKSNTSCFIRGGGIAVEVESFQQYSVTFCCCATYDSRGAV